MDAAVSRSNSSNSSIHGASIRRAMILERLLRDSAAETEEAAGCSHHIEIITRFATTSEHFSHRLHDEWMPPFIHQGSITDEIPVTNQFCWTTGCKVILLLLIHSFFHVWQLYHMEVTALCHSRNSVSLTLSWCTPRMDRISNFKVDSHRNQDFLPLKLIQNSENLAPKKIHIQLRYGQFFGICLIWLVWS